MSKSSPLQTVVGDDVLPVTIIEAGSINRRVPLAELWANRSIVMMLIRRAIVGRYRDTWLGFFWAVAQPLAYMLVLNLFFGVLGRHGSVHIPYPVFLFSALVPYQFFSRCAGEGSASLRGNQGLLDKVYVPRMVFPLSIVGTAFFDFFVAMLLLIFMLMFFHIAPTWNLAALPILLVFLVMFGAGSAILLSILTITYNDLRVAITVILQIWFFATPIIYPASIVPVPLQPFYGLNPMVGLVEAFRWSLLGQMEFPDLRMVATSAAMILLVFIGAIVHFRRKEVGIADAM